MRSLAAAASLTLLLCGVACSRENPHPVPASITVQQRITDGVNDFMSFYAAGKLCGTKELYNAASTFREEENATGFVSLNTPTVRLPFFALLMRPLARLPYRPAYYTFQALSLLCILCFIVLERSRGALVACLFSFPLFLTICVAQDVAILLLLFAIFLRCYDTRPRIAGAVLALCILKYQLLLFMPLVLILRWRKQVVISLTATVSVLFAISFAVAGPGWPRQYVQQLLGSWDVPEHMPNIRSLVIHSAHPMFFNVVLCVLTAAMATAALIRWRHSVAVSTAVALACAILVSPHIYTQDCAVLIAPLVAAWRNTTNRLVSAGAAALLVPIPYFLRLVDGPLTYLTQACLFAFIATSALAASARGHSKFSPCIRFKSVAE